MKILFWDSTLAPKIRILVRSALFVPLLIPLLPVPARADLEFLEPARLEATIKKNVARLKIGADADLLNASIYQGVGICAKYKYVSEPSWHAGFFTRVDQYTLAADVNPGDIVEDLGLPISFHVKKDVVITYARQFHSREESLAALPYAFRQFPANAQRVLQNLNVGDFVSFQADLNLLLGVGASFVPQPWVNVGVSTSVLVSGQFLVQVFKASDRKARVRFVAARDRGASVGGNVSLGSGLSVVGLNLVERLVEGKVRKVVNFTPLAIDASRKTDDLFLLDYLFDLSDAKAAEAFDSVMARDLKFTEVALTDPFASRGQLQDMLVTDLSPVEALYDANKSRSEGQRVVDRIFKGSDSVQSESADFKIGLNMIRYQDGSTFSQNKVVSFDQNDQGSKFLMDTYSHDESALYLFQNLGSVTTNAASLVLSAAPDWSPRQFVGMTAGRTVKLKHVSASDYAKMQDNAKDMLPSAAYAQIQWKPWTFGFLSPANGTFRQEVFFTPEAIAAIPNRTAEDFSRIFLSYLEQFGEPRVNPQNPPAGNVSHLSWEERFDQDITFIGQNLALIFDPSKEISARVQAFEKLRGFPIFQDRGIGYLVAFLPSGKLTQLIRYQMVFSADKADEISFQFGNLPERAAFDSLSFIEGVLSDDHSSFNLTPPGAGT